jgi:hypothetical protein
MNMPLMWHSKCLVVGGFVGLRMRRNGWMGQEWMIPKPGFFDSNTEERRNIQRPMNFGQLLDCSSVKI